MAQPVQTAERKKKEGTPVVTKSVSVIKFSAEWCKPCGFLAKELKGIDLEIKNVDVDSKEGTILAQQFKVRNIPLIIFLDENENEIHRHAGMINQKTLLDTVNALEKGKVNPDYQELVAKVGSPQVDNKLFVYSQVLDFGKNPLNSLNYYCDDIKLVTEYGTNQNDIDSFVKMLNESPQDNGSFSAYGTYFNNGDGRVRLEAFPEVLEKYCPNGKMSLLAFWD